MSEQHSHGRIPEPAPAPEFDPNGRRIYRCGTLTYTKGGLVLLCGWLLWGDFCFTLMEAVIPSILPLKLRSLDSSNMIIALIMTTLPAVFNTTVAPWVSFRSDNYRSRWGRRIPFILSTMPFLVGSLLLIGFSDPVGAWIHKSFLSGGTITRDMVIVGLVAFFACMFDLFNMFVGSVYYYLFNDVVPTQYLGRFMSWFRLVGVLSAAGYNAFVFKHAMDHMEAIYVGAGVLYLVGFGAMCFMVKEGEYPPPSDAGIKPSLINDVKSFATHCFTSRYYWDIFLYGAFSAASQSCAVFMVFFNQSLGLDLDQIGKLGAATGVVTAAYLLVAGVYVDRWNPVRADAYLVTFNVFGALGALVWLFLEPINPKVIFMVLLVTTLPGAAISALRGAAELPRLMVLFPKERFGQFCGAMTLVRYAGVTVSGVSAGLFLDWVKKFYPAGSLFPYRFIQVWPVVFLVLAYVFYYRAYRCWKRLGGDLGYTPPREAFKYKDLPKSPTPGIVRGALVVPLMVFLTGLGTSLFLIYYSLYQARSMHNAMIFGVFMGIAMVAMAAYLWFIGFMERA